MQFSRSHGLLLLWASLWTVAASTVIVLTLRAVPAGDRLGFWEESGRFLSVIVVPCVSVLVVGFMGWLCHDADGPKFSGRELDHLVHLKRQGGLVPRFPRKRGTSPRVHESGPSPERSPPFPGTSEGVLDRLVQRKHRGRWFRPTA